LRYPLFYSEVIQSFILLILVIVLSGLFFFSFYSLTDEKISESNAFDVEYDPLFACQFNVGSNGGGVGIPVSKLSVEAEESTQHNSIAPQLSARKNIFQADISSAASNPEGKLNFGITKRLSLLSESLAVVTSIQHVSKSIFN
jgi:hypothetical protein